MEAGQAYEDDDKEPVLCFPVRQERGTTFGYQRIWGGT